MPGAPAAPPSCARSSSPGDTQEKCVALTRGLGLAFAGIDLKVTPAGEIFCFEVNPSPAFSFFEANTGQPIADSLARHLAGY